MYEGFVSRDQFLLALVKDPSIQGVMKGVGLTDLIEVFLQTVIDVHHGKVLPEAMSDPFISRVISFLDSATKSVTHRVTGKVDLAVPTGVDRNRGNVRMDAKIFDQKFEVLSKYATDMTALAADGKIDPVIGRDQEIRRVIRILCRRTKNNPVLIGEPGVGKTTVVEVPTVSVS